MANRRKIMEFVFDKVPTTIDEFVAQRDKLASTAHGGAAIFILSFYIWQNVDKTLGEKCFVVSLDRSLLTQSPTGKNSYKKFAPSPREIKNMEFRVGKKDYLSRSYFYPVEDNGNEPSPENMYAFDPKKKFKIVVYQQHRDVLVNNRLKVFVMCTGASSARPISLIKNNRGVFKVKEYSSIQVGVQYKVLVDDDI